MALPMACIYHKSDIKRWPKLWLMFFLLSSDESNFEDFKLRTDDLDCYKKAIRKTEWLLR